MGHFKQPVIVVLAGLLSAGAIAVSAAEAPARAVEALWVARGDQAPRPPSLGSVRLTRRVMADGKPLPAGTYQVRLTEEAPSQAAPGASANLERYVEFVQGGQVKGREVASIIPDGDLKDVAKMNPPAAAGSRVELLKGGDYLRVWIRRGGNSYLIHLPPA